MTAQETRSRSPYPHHGEVTTLAQVKRWPATVNVGDAAKALGVSKSALYLAIQEGNCPAETILVGRRIKVLTASLIAVLEGQKAGAA